MLRTLFVYLQYVQVFLFLLLYSYPRRIPFYLIILFSLIVYVLSPGILPLFGLNNYSVPLLQFYNLQILASYLWFNRIYPGSAKAVSLSFLLPFLNSIFWEFPLHLADLLVYGASKNLTLQCYHFLPLILFIKPLRKNIIQVARASVWNWVFTIVLFEYRIHFDFGAWDLVLGLLNRGVSYLVLIHTYRKLSESKIYHTIT